MGCGTVNKARRESLRRAIAFLDAAQELTDNALVEEQDCLDNILENLEGSDRYSDMEDVVSNLESAVEYIEESKAKIEESI